MNVEYIPDSETLAIRGSEVIARTIRETLESRDSCTVALSGGAGPQPAYARLSREVLPWERIEFYFGDERVVPPDSNRSNYKMANESLLRHISIPASNVHRIRGELAPPKAAALYDRELRELADRTEQRIPTFDLMLLGVGPCGHTASLFPGTPALEDIADLATWVEVPESSPGLKDARFRVTMTLPVINSSRHILFMVDGEKTDALRRVEAGDPSVPAGRVAPVAGDILWLIVR